MKLEYSNRLSVIGGYTILIILAIFGAHYALIRFTAFDAAYYLFQIAEGKDFFVAHGRHISYFAQWPAVIAANLGIPMKLLLPIASLGYSLFFILNYYFAVRFKTKENLYWLVVFLPLLALRFKFYSPISESIMSLASISLFYVVMDNATQAFSKKKWVFLFLIAITIYIGHPLAFMGLFIMIFFHAFWHGDYLNKTRLYAMGIATAFFVAKMISVQSSGYESEKLGDATSNLSKLFSARNHWVYLDLDDWIIAECFWPLITFIGAILLLVYRKRIIPAAFLILTFVAIKHIITFVYWEGETPNMLHSYYAYLSIPWSLGIIYAASFIPKKGFVLGFYLCLCIQSIWEIREERTFFQDRLAYFDSIFDVYPENRKQILPEVKLEMEKVHLTWAIPFETMIYTSYSDPRDAKTLFINRWMEGDEHLLKSEENPAVFLGAPWYHYEIENSAELNPDYFILPPEPYIMH
ncbi:hypothetical protein O3Q51_15890 [Cryomorphaceae bacterium 1068]|nr:hypothetical protein [Cryomorphaceae bacterium 1068]